MTTRHRTHIFREPKPQVFDAAVAAAQALGLAVTQADKKDGHLYLSQPWSWWRQQTPLAVTMTDSGLGTTVVHISWDTRRQVLWPLPHDGSTAARLHRGIRKHLAQQRL